MLVVLDMCQTAFSRQCMCVALIDPVDRSPAACRPQHRVTRTNKKTPRGVGGLRDE